MTIIIQVDIAFVIDFLPRLQSIVDEMSKLRAAASEYSNEIVFEVYII